MFDSVKKRMEELASLIEEHNKNYYVLTKPVISDLQFDALFNELLSLEKKHPELVSPNSPTKKVGSDLDAQSGTVKHIIPLLSLDKVYTLPEIKDWYSKYESQNDTPLFLSMEPKIDGFSVVLEYKNGSFFQALSRGNGFVGNNITTNIKTISSLPLTLNSPLTYLIRGEVFINKKDFERINQNSETDYANPRNFAAGVIRRLKNDDVTNVPLRFFVYDATCLEEEFISHFEMFDFLIQNQFPIAPFTSFFNSLTNTSEDLFHIQPTPCPLEWGIKTIHALDCIDTMVQEIEKKRPSLEFEIDGLVFKLNSKKLRLLLGETNHHPRWAMAFKFESPKAVATVLNIITQVGRTGKITPLAVLTPTLINGSTVSKATLHNQDYINSLELGIGDIVEISKRGEIIPAIERVLEKNGTTFIIPSFCPSCHTLLIEKGAHLFCPSSTCPQKIIGELYYFTQTLEIEGFGPSIIEILYHQFHITRPFELFSFDYTKLLELEGFKNKKINNYQKSLRAVLINKTFKDLLIALGIPEISEKAITTLIENDFDSLSKINALADENSIEKINQFFGIGKVTAQTIIETLSSHSPYTLILKELEKVGFVLEEKRDLSKPTYPPLLFGSTWVITGTFEHFKPREKVVKIIKALNGKIAATITSHTTHLLAGEDAGSKLSKAQKLKTVKIMKESEFIELIPSVLMNETV